MVVLFTLTSVVAAALLFLVQPMVARMVLPAFGGSPHVWTTAMLFFQTALLAGYAYSHFATNFLPRKIQVWLHVGLLLLPLVLLPISLTVTPSEKGGITPSLELLVALALGVAGPFVMVATSGPLIQRWFSWTNHPRANDPYFLYAAGNAGSICGLLLYPFVVEPNLSIEQQSRVWMYAYWGAATLLALCALMVHRSLSPKAEPNETETEAVEEQPAKKSKKDPNRNEAEGKSKKQISPTTEAQAVAVPVIGKLQWLYWMLLAFIPSSLMLGVTSHLSMDIASIPMLWIFPLVAYLLTFTIAFSSFGDRALKLASLAAPPLVVAALTVKADTFGTPTAIVLQVALVLIGGLIAHGKLSATRPHPSQLTGFYVVMSIGGALGGLFNGLLAPLVFPHIFEYGLVVTLMLGLVVSWKEMVVDADAVPAYVWMPIGVLIFCIPLTLLGLIELGYMPANFWMRAGIVLLLLGLLFTKYGKSMLLMAAVAIVSLVPPIHQIMSAKSIQRTFFGVHRVTEAGGLRKLVHGTTSHGIQDVTSDESKKVALSYYHADQPLGEVFKISGFPANVGAVGLGAGTVAAYAKAGTNLVFHEIDPAVKRIAESQFSFIEDAMNRGANVSTVIGDGRMTLKDKVAAYDLLIVDAFSSDSIPVHMLTVEAIQVYLESIKPNGIIAIHVSNNYLDLPPVLSAAAENLKIPMLQRIGDPAENTQASRSHWIAISSNATLMNELRNKGWQDLPEKKILWTDQRSSLWNVRKH